MFFLAFFSGAVQGIPERGFICIKVGGFALLILFNLPEISYENEIVGLSVS